MCEGCGCGCGEGVCGGGGGGEITSNNVWGSDFFCHLLL